MSNYSTASKNELVQKPHQRVLMPFEHDEPGNISKRN